jgi:hypothetical protein
MQTRLATPPLCRGSAAPYCPTSGHLRCVKRAVDASARGDHLEAVYWLNLADAARRRSASEPPRSHTPFGRLMRACALLVLPAERVA